MRFFQASLMRDETGKWVMVHCTEVGNPLKMRTDRFFKGASVLRIMVAPEDSISHQWQYVEPLELALRYLKHSRAERERIDAILNA